MKVVCEGIYLSEAVLKVVKACASKTTVPVMECIKISAKNDSVVLAATDGEILITKKIKAEVYEDGDICVPGRYFSDFIKKLENVQIGLTVVDKRMIIEYGDSKSEMQVLAADDFPKIETDIKENNFVIKTDDFKRLVSSTTFCCATDDSRPILKGCQIIVKDNGVCMTAIDGFRLATYNGKCISSSDDFEIVCPARTLNEIEKMLPSGDGETTVFIQRNYILVSVDDTIITSRLYVGDFIKKDNIIPRSFMTTVECSKEELKASVERASILVRSDKNSLVIFDINGDSIRISSNSEIGNVNESVKASIDGKDIKIAMNSKFIMEAINAIEEDEMVLSFNNQVQPFICENKKNKDCLYLILPVRTANNA